MTGPDYPNPPDSGANAIGIFATGISPIGTIAPFNVWTTIQQEYANSAGLINIILFLNSAIDQTKNLDDFFDLMWNVATAQGYGLDVWGRIVGVGRILNVASGENLGFEEASGAGITGWNQGPFYSGVSVTSNYSLADDAFRTLIYAKALSNICDGSIPGINSILQTLFPGKSCYVTNGQNMTMTYTFNFALTTLEQAIVEGTGILPTPAGVTATFVINP